MCAIVVSEPLGNEQTQEWLVSWGLIEADACFERLVDTRLHAAIPA